MALTLKEQTRFFGQLSALLNAGLTLHHGLTMAGKDCRPAFQTYLSTLTPQLAQGQSFAAVLNRSPRWFDRWTIQLIQMAEYSGALPELLRQLSLKAEQQQRQGRLIQSAQRSLFLTAFSLLLVGFVLLNYRQTTLLLQPGFWLNTFLLTGVVLGLGLGLQRVPGLQPLWYQWMQQIPVVQTLLQLRALLAFTQLALPLQCGVPLLSAVELTQAQVADPALARTLSLAARQIRAGQPLSSSLKSWMPAIALQMIRTGEETGDLVAMLHKLAEYTESELERLLRQIQGILWPLGLLSTGGIVLLIGIQMVQSLIKALPG